MTDADRHIPSGRTLDLSPVYGWFAVAVLGWIGWMLWG